MNKLGNASALKEANIKKTEDARRKALNSIEYFKKNRKPITYSGISKHSGVSRSFLHSDEEISVVMKKYAGTNEKIKKTQDSKDVIISSLKFKIKELEKKIKEQEENEKYKIKYLEAEAENKRLKEQLRKSYKF